MKKLMENEDKVNKFNNEINLFLSKLKTTSMTSKQQLRLKTRFWPFEILSIFQIAAKK